MKTQVGQVNRWKGGQVDGLADGKDDGNGLSAQDDEEDLSWSSELAGFNGDDNNNR